MIIVAVLGDMKHECPTCKSDCGMYISASVFSVFMSPEFEDSVVINKLIFYVLKKAQIGNFLLIQCVFLLLTDFERVCKLNHEGRKTLCLDQLLV